MSKPVWQAHLQKLDRLCALLSKNYRDEESSNASILETAQIGILCVQLGQSKIVKAENREQVRQMADKHNGILVTEYDSRVALPFEKRACVAYVFVALRALRDHMR